MQILSLIKKILPEVDSEYSDNFDGKYKYIKSAIPVPRPIARMLNLPERKPDRRKKRFGRIMGNPFYYITFPMLFVFFLVAFTAVSSFEGLVVYFNTNIFLNGLIISLMIFGILKVFHNSYMLYGTARFFRKMEKVMYKDVLDEDDIPNLRNALESHGELVNTLYMSQTIDNVEKFGHPNFNGMRSRLIKSKLGQRTSKNKSNVNFIAGILVMLGLLGTFLGLLATIDAVGEALNSMSNLGGDGGEIGMEEMTGFIGSLAAPLQGMGLAFSSSLFGLSGSLLIGFFLHLGGTPQNEFIENVSRWIDNREVKFDPNVKKGSGAKVPPSDDDLKEWLSGFIHMSVKSNRVITKFSQDVMNSTAETTKAWTEVRGLSEAQKSLNISAKAMGENIEMIKNQGQAVSTVLPQVIQSIPQITKQLDTIGSETNNMSATVNSNNKALSQFIEHQRKNSDLGESSSLALKDLMSKSYDIQKQGLDIQIKNARELGQNQSELLKEIKQLLGRLQKDPHMAQTESLVKQLNNVLGEFNKKTKSLFSSKDK